VQDYDTTSGRVYDVSAGPNNVTIKPFLLPSEAYSIFPADDSRILVRTADGILMWSLGQLTDTRDVPHYDRIVHGIDLSCDASLLAVATDPGIEIWDARIGQRRKLIPTGDEYRSRVVFSPAGEFIVFVCERIISVVDVRAGELLPTTYSFSPRRDYFGIDDLGISFNSSKLAAVIGYYNESQHRPDEARSDIYVWDLPSGALLHSLDCNKRVQAFRWSWTDQYLLFEPLHGNPRYLNAETFQEEILEDCDDRFQKRDHLYYDWDTRTIRLSGTEGPPLLTLRGGDLDARNASLRGDRACFVTMDGQLLLLDMSNLEAYKEICGLPFQREAADTA